MDAALLEARGARDVHRAPADVEGETWTARAFVNRASLATAIAFLAASELDVHVP